MEEEKKKEIKKENSTELQKPNLEAEVINNNRKCGKKKEYRLFLDYFY